MSEIIIVTGLPRSGTSLMMQILKKVPLEIKTDNLRKSDINNPEGYYEFEAVKGISKNNQFLKDCQGKVIKIVAPLPQFIDLNLKYKVIFMRRDLDEVLISQEKMLKKDQSLERDKFKNIYELHLKRTRQFFDLNKIPILDVEFRELMSNPEIEIEKLIQFLNLNCSNSKLIDCINPNYYRSKC